MNEIARRLGRDKGTVSRELSRNAATRSGRQVYRATVAQWKAQQAAKRPKTAKLVVNPARPPDRPVGFTVGGDHALVDAPSQRPTNKNTNGLLRQYFPKGTDLSRWSAEDLEAVALTLNNRPRKTLGWRTPAEVFQEHLLLLEQAGVATTG